MMLAVAGNETTRNAITHGMHAFLTNPDQWKLWVEERPDTMVDEVIRWASPIIVFQRTAINDTMVGDQLVKAGLVIAIEPWFLHTTDEIFTDPDGWTLRSADGSRGAHMEHTVAITKDGPLVLTARD